MSTSPLLAHNPRVDAVIGYDPTTPLSALADEIRNRRITHGVDLHGSLRSRRLRRLVGGPWRGYPKQRLARAVLIRTKRDAYRDKRHVVERYFDAARDLDVAPDERSLEFFIPRETQVKAKQFLAATGLGTDRTLVAVAPGAAHATKRWALPHWQRLVGDLVTRYDVVIVGGRDDVALGDEVAAAGGPQAVNAAGRFDAAGSAALLKEARCVVSGDTGVMHLGTAVGTPVVALFGPTVEAFGFFPWRARATVLQRDLTCRPCSAFGGDRCPIETHACLVEITPAEVAEAVRRLPR
jgi:heptosyltransferase-2